MCEMMNDEEDFDPGVGPSSSSNIAIVTSTTSTSQNSPMAGASTPIEADDVRLHTFNLRHMLIILRNQTASNVSSPGDEFVPTDSETIVAQYYCAVPHSRSCLTTC